jgi:hypothetical protein
LPARGTAGLSAARPRAPAQSEPGARGGRSVSGDEGPVEPPVMIDLPSSGRKRKPDSQER